MKQEKAYMAGGCFWGMEELIRKLPGVISTEVGYMGGESENPTYKQICTGTTFHAETLEVIFDSEAISYRELLKKFFMIHDPTTKDRQANDIGTQYRSALFPTNQEQQSTAEELIAKLNASGVFSAPIVTTVEKISQFWKAEDYHQDYLIANPDGYNCHYFHKVDLSKI